MAKTPAPVPRTAKDVIDSALKDNAAWEWLCFGLVVLLVVTGLTAVVLGIILGKDLVALGGSGVTGLFWPALGYARRLRETNIRVRLYEIPLAQATRPKSPPESSARRSVARPLQARERSRHETPAQVALV